jgi:methylase of polypeptide subunit release factors
MNLILIAVLLIVIYFLLRPIVNGAVFLPTNLKNMEVLMELSRARDGEKIADLGSGDGRILLAFAKAGIEAHGYEIDPILVWWSRRQIEKAGFEKKAFVHWKSFWKINLSSYSVITVYGIPYIMKRLGAKLRRELGSGARILSYIYPFPGWQAERKENGIYLYRIKGNQ